MVDESQVNKDYEQWLASEREFADSAYKATGQDLSISPHMLLRYMRPVAKWDFRQAMVRGLGEIRGKKVLDFGCGMGEESMYLAKLGAHVTAIDISEVGIDLTRKRSEFNKLPVRALVTDCLHSGLPGGTFDAVHCLGVLHHIGLEKGLVETHRMLKPGGRMVLAEHVSVSPVVEALRTRFGSEKTSDDEGPVPLTELLHLPVKIGFRVDAVSHFAIFYRLRSRVPVFGNVFFQKVDYALVNHVPGMKALAGCTVLALTKL